MFHSGPAGLTDMLLVWLKLHMNFFPNLIYYTEGKKKKVQTERYSGSTECRTGFWVFWGKK